MEILSPIKDGIVADWDMVDSVWEHAFSGGGSTTISPVHDGYVLQKFKKEYNGINMFCLSSSAIHTNSHPREFWQVPFLKHKRKFQVTLTDVDVPDTAESYKLFCQRMIISDIKDSVCRVPDTPYNDRSYSNIPMTSYELPDGQTLEIGADLMLCSTLPLFRRFLEGELHRHASFGSRITKNAGGWNIINATVERAPRERLGRTRVKVLASGGNTSERRFRFEKKKVTSWQPKWLYVQYMDRGE